MMTNSDFNRLRRVALLLLTLTLWASAQSGGAVEFADQASRVLRHQTEKGLELQWNGLDRVAGEVFEVTFDNRGSEKVEVRTVPGMVLVDADGLRQPVLLESVTGFELEPGASTSRTLRGYSLDRSAARPSGTAHGYALSSSADHAAAVKVLWAGLRLEKEGKLKPVLSTQQYRTIVIQRAIWAALGGENPSTREDLRLDLIEDTRAGGHSFSEEKLAWLSEAIWKDVELVRAAAESE